MKKLFPGHYAPSTSFQDALPDALVVFDTNVLLNFYEFGPLTRERTFKALGKIQDQCWLPYHVALEFHRSRLGRIERAFQSHQDAITKLNTGVKALTESIEKQDVLKHDPRTGKLIQAFKKAGEALAKHAEKAADELPKKSSEDPVNESLAEIFNGRVGRHPTQDEVDAINKDGKRRFEHKHPPALTDAKKEGERFLDRDVSYAGEFGDLYIWKQTLEHIARSEKKGFLIFVTDERKQDWWAKEGSNTILGPSPALSQELALAAPGWNLRMYNSVWFFKQLGDAVDVQLSSEDLAEIREAATSTEVSMVPPTALKNFKWMYPSRSRPRRSRIDIYEQWVTMLARTREKGATISASVEDNYHIFWEHTKLDEVSRMTLLRIVERSDEPLSSRLQSLTNETLQRGSALGVPCAVVFDTTDLAQSEANDLMSHFIFEFSLTRWPVIQTIYIADVITGQVNPIQVA